MPIGRPWFDDGIWRESLDGRYRWRGNVSSDQVVGVIFGYYVYFARVADTADRALLAEKVRQLVGRILDDDLRIIGYDGKVTTWGHYEPSYVVNREPMNALLLLQMVKIAQVVTGDARFDREYRRLTDEGELNYARIAENARLDVPPLEANHSDDMLIALALYSLLELEQQPTIKPYLLEAARRWFYGVTHPGGAVEANPFASFLWHHWTGETDHDSAAFDTLRNMPLDMKWNPDTIERYARRFGFSLEPEASSPEPAPGKPLPIDRRGRTWSFLVHNPYRAGVARATPAPFETNGMDYLVSYWFGRAHGMVAGDQ